MTTSDPNAVSIYPKGSSFDGNELIPVPDQTLDPQFANAEAGRNAFQAPIWFKAEQMGREIGPEMALSSALTGGQYALMAAKTDQDRFNKSELERLQDLQAKGKLGLDAQERQILERQQLDPVRALAGEGQLRDEAMMASMGNTSASMQNAAIQRGRQAVAQQARAAGLNIAQVDLARKREQEAEIRTRIGYEAEVQQRNREFLSQALAGLAEPAGTAMAGRAVSKVDLDALIAKFGQEEAMGLYSQMLMGEIDPRLLTQMSVNTIQTGGDVGGAGAGPE